MLKHSKKLAFVWAIVGLLALPAMNAIADEAEGGSGRGLRGSRCLRDARGP